MWRVMKQESFNYGQLFEVLGWTTNKFGVTAEIKCYDEKGDWVCQDNVRLWDRQARQKLAKLFLKKIRIPKERRYEHLHRIDKDFCKIAELIKQKESEASTTKTETRSEQPHAMTEEERNEALALLKDPDLLERTRQNITTMGIVGEDDNKVLVYLIGTSRKMKDPLGATVKASSSSGKNNLTFRRNSCICFSAAKFSKHLPHTMSLRYSIGIVVLHTSSITLKSQLSIEPHILHVFGLIGA